MKIHCGGNSGISANFATGDFDGDGRMEILAGDNEGNGIHTRSYWKQPIQTNMDTARSPEGTPQLFAAGDMDSDGNDEFAICAKTGNSNRSHENSTSDITTGFWLFSNQMVMIPIALCGRNVFVTCRDGGNGMTIADANNDGRNELCIAVHRQTSTLCSMTE